MSNRNIISDHLLVRWLERVEGYDLKTIRDAMDRAGLDPKSDRETLNFIDTHFDFDLSRLRRELMSVIAPALRMRARYVNYRGSHIALKGGVAVTVLDKGMARYNFGRPK